VRYAQSTWPDARIDAIAYGRAAADTPAPEGSAGVGAVSPALPASAVTLLRSLVGRRYDVAVVVQPVLAMNRARGALLGFAAAAGRGDPVAVDPQSSAARVISRRAAVADAVRFVLLQAACSAIAAAAAAVLARLRVAAPRRGLPGSVVADDPVVYLRTDLELAIKPLTAGGSLSHTRGIARALLRRGQAVELWTTGEMADLPDGLRQRRLPVLLRANIPIEVAELLSSLLQAWVLARAASRPAFVYQRYSLNNLAGLVLAGRWKAPLLMEVNASEVTWRREWSTLRFPRLATACERLVLRHSDTILTVSENARRDLLEMGADPRLVKIVPNGVDVEQFRGAKPRCLPFPSRSFVVGFTGLFYPWHGTRYLAEAFALLRRRYPDARLLMVGDGEEAPLVRSILAREGLERDTLLTGVVPQHQVPGYLAAADVLVAPYGRNDDFIGSPVKIWEYMASGRAIVATRVAQIGQVLRDRDTALVVSPSDPPALAAAFAELHDDEQLRARLGARAQVEAAQQHSWDARLAAALAASEA
jgi:glycosyltransferase involved in cell wall biosynthesis